MSNNEISEEKRMWMESVGIVELKQPMKFWAPDNEMLYSEDYLKNTPLEEIQAGYERTLKRMKQKEEQNVLEEGITMPSEDFQRILDNAPKVDLRTEKAEPEELLP
ncbi:hypothetical protein ACPC37_34765 [Streptomyces griseoincarnatus]|uniref:hypothetical protein n=1 Tax=Paenibacillus glucanolyticus TaxID=59843 RepID=UPI003681A7E3